MNEVQLGDVKVRIIHTIYEDDIAQDISASTTKEIILQDPNGVSYTYSANFLTNGSDGKLYYDTLSGELNIAGTWKTQAKIILSGGTYRSSVSSFRVNSNL